MPKGRFTCSRLTCGALRNTETFSKLKIALDRPGQREGPGWHGACSIARETINDNTDRVL
jgi:hypothetical protein